MKVLLINGSPNRAGCTYTALSEAAAQLEKKKIGTEIFRPEPERSHYTNFIR